MSAVQNVPEVADLIARLSGLKEDVRVLLANGGHPSLAKSTAHLSVALSVLEEIRSEGDGTSLEVLGALVDEDGD